MSTQCRWKILKGNSKMKVRRGFVSNSSSSSFIIDKKDLSLEQIALIKNHYVLMQNPEIASQLETKIYDPIDEWEITETDNTIQGFTYMDNFDLEEFVEKIVKVDPKNIKDDF